MASDLQFELATPNTEAQVRQLLNDNALSGKIRVALTREPDAFHAAAISGDDYQLILGYTGAGRRLVGTGSRFELDLYVNGSVQTIGYLGELRIDGGLKKRRRLLIEAYRELRRYHEAGRVPYYITTIIADNSGARRLLEAGLGDMPNYQPLEPIVTLTIPAKKAARGKSPGRRIETNLDTDIEQIVHELGRVGPGHQFQPVWTTETLRSSRRCRGLSYQNFFLAWNGDRLLGCIALWDQRKFKQTMIRSYARKLARLRPAFNLVAPLISQPALPAPGSRLNSAFLSHAAIEQDDPETAIALIRHACRDASLRGIDYVMLGLAERSPLLAEIKRQFSCHSYVSMLYLVYWEDGRQAASQLDDRIPQIEVAIL